MEIICIEGNVERAEGSAEVLIERGGEEVLCVLWNFLLGSSAQQHKLRWIACGRGTKSHDLTVESLAVDKVADAKVIRCLCYDAQIPTTLGPQKVHKTSRPRDCDRPYTICTAHFISTLTCIFESGVWSGVDMEHV
jgi:hypothetical protein